MPPASLRTRLRVTRRAPGVVWPTESRLHVYVQITGGAATRQTGSVKKRQRDAGGGNAEMSEESGPTRFYLFNIMYKTGHTEWDLFGASTALLSVLDSKQREVEEEIHTLFIYLFVCVCFNNCWRQGLRSHLLIFTRPPRAKPQTFSSDTVSYVIRKPQLQCLCGCVHLKHTRTNTHSPAVLF